MSSGMGKRFFTSVVCLLVIGACSTAMADVACDFQLQTTYQFGNRADSLGGGNGSPDTGAAVIANTGICSLSGDFKTVAIAGNGGDYSFDAGVVAWSAGATHSIEIGPESSNVGGFNGGSPRQGVEMLFSGTVSFGADSVPFSFDVFDKDVHSGVPRSANGHTSDSYVLQGGDPFGGDTGDGFETTQAPGVMAFEAIIKTSSAVPEPSSIALLGSSLLACCALLRRRMRKQ